MFTLALFIGIYGFVIYFLGLIGILYWPLVVLFTVGFVGGILYVYWKYLKRIGLIVNELKGYLLHHPFFSLFVAIFAIQACINFVGVLGPEISFDALWYHLTFPKLYLSHHAIFHIPGGLLYYSDMPKFIELIYTGALSFHIAFLPKAIHFLFGILASIALFKLSRRWFSPFLSIVVVIIFYSNLVVGWESITAYIDLGRTFFEVMAVWAFFLWTEKRKQKWFYFSSLMVGFAIASKIIAFPTLLIMAILIFLVGRKYGENPRVILKWILSYSVVALLIPLPWFVFAIIHTGNPFYPLFDPVLGNAGSSGWQLINPLHFITAFWDLFIHGADPLSPWYLMLLPLTIFRYKEAKFSMKLLYVYTFLALIFWYITPSSGGRFFLPYLPVLSILSVYPLLFISKKQAEVFLLLVIVLAFVSIGYRGLANKKFLPVIFHKESTENFLAKNLNFSYGDFADTDDYFKTHIKNTDTVLLYGFHNLYYVDFPFIDSSWVTKGDAFNYIAVENGSLPRRFSNWNLVYTNPITHVSLYTAGRIPWTY